MTTEYEQLLERMIQEKKLILSQLTDNEKKKRKIMGEISFLEVELARYRQALALFRTKGLPKVGRWGRPETEERKE